jgi:hypothetical protein
MTGRSEGLIDPMRWADMEPAVRLRFHELGNHISRLEGVIAGINMRVPSDPAEVPVLREKVANLESGQRAIEEKVDKINEKLNSLSIRVVASTTAATGVVSILVNTLLK